MAFTAIEEQQLRDLLGTLAIEPEDIKRTYDLVEAASSASILDYYFPIDKSGLVEAESFKIDNFLFSGAVVQQASGVDYKGLTPKGFAESTATTTNLGIVTKATNAKAEAATDSDAALVSSNLPGVFNTRFKKTKGYVSGDFDATASNYTTISITAWNEMLVGDYVVMEGYFIIETNDVPNIEIVLNATKSPLSLKGITISRFASPHYIPHGAAIVTSSGKFKMTISNSDGGQFGAGTHEFAFSLTYLAG